MSHKCGVLNETFEDDSDDSVELQPVGLPDLKPQFKKFCTFPSFLGLPLQIPVPEQTEPEDLSMHTPRSNFSNEDFEELDDAAAMFMRLKQRQLEKCVMESFNK